jgi:hypothetical protein
MMELVYKFSVEHHFLCQLKIKNKCYATYIHEKNTCTIYNVYIKKGKRHYSRYQYNKRNNRMCPYPWDPVEVEG